MKFSSLQTKVNKFTPKKYYEIGPWWSLVCWRFCVIQNKSVLNWTPCQLKPNWTKIIYRQKEFSVEGEKLWRWNRLGHGLAPPVNFFHLKHKKSLNTLKFGIVLLAWCKDTPPWWHLVEDTLLNEAQWKDIRQHDIWLNDIGLNEIGLNDIGLNGIQHRDIK